MIDPDDVQAAALALWEADATKTVIGPLTETYPDIDVVDAYEIQLVNIRKRLDAGALVRGHKVGLSAKAMQQMLGVHEPDYGHLLDDMFVDPRPFRRATIGLRSVGWQVRKAYCPGCGAGLVRVR